MADITEALQYIQRLERIVTSNMNPLIFNRKFIKKTQVDDLLCCFLAKIPDVYKAGLKRRVTNINDLPSISAFNRLSKVIKIPFFLNKEYYMIPYAEVLTLLKTVQKNMDRDVRTLEER